MSSSFRRGPSSSAAPPEMAGPLKSASLASLGASTLGGDLTESAHADPNDLTDDSLEIMREIVMRIRNDPEFAASIYADCPRLQHLLEQRPDLRPIFEDPNLVRINFEQVYRDAGGKLPEDEEAEKEQAKSRVAGFRAILVKIVNHPLFKVLRFLLLIKKIVTCFTGGGMSMVRGLFQHLCCSGAVDAVGSHPDGSGGGGPDAQAHHGGIDGSPDGPDASNNAATKAALDKVATHMEDPEVQAQMQDLLQNDPDGLQDAINNDPELSALRDSNPLCAELMKDPDTMKILVDPDNLRALGDCPDLIEQDFADPDWSPPDLEAGGVGAGGGHGLDMMGGGGGGHDMIDLDLDNPDGGGTDVVEIDLDGDGQVDGIDVDGDGQVDGAVPTDASGAAAGGGGGGDNVLQDYELGDSNNNDGGGAARSMGGGGGGNKGRGAKGPNQARSGFISSVGAGFTDLIAQQVVGVGFSDLMPTLGGDVTDALGLDGLDGIDDGGAADSADQAASAGQAAAATGQFAAVSSAVQGGDNFFSNYGDQLDTLERGMDDIEEQADAFAAGSSAGGAAASAGAHGGQMAGAAAMGVSAAEGAIIGTAFMGNDDNKRRGGSGHVSRGVGGTIPEDEPIIMVDDGDDEPEEKKKRFGWFGELGSALATAAKESIAGAILGDDLGELIVEKQEERKEEKEKEKEREKNASKRDLNASLSESMSGSRSNLNGSVGDMNRSKSSLGPSSPLGKKASKGL